MNELELKEQLIDLRSQWQALLDAGEAEKRELNEEETGKIAEIRTKMDEVEGRLNAIKAENERLAKEQEERQIKNKENKSKETMKDVRLLDLINGVVEGRQFNEAEAPYMVNARTINTRGAIQAQVEGAGQENVPEEKMGLDVAIRNASVLNKIGATWFGNAVGDISIPKYAGSNVAWKGEIVEAADGASAFTETILSPKRLTAYVDISKQFLAQSSVDAEAILIRDLANAISEKLDKTVFGSVSGSTNQPAGLFSGATSGASSALTYDDVLELEEAVEEKNGVDFIFIANPKVKYALKGAQMASGLDMVYSKGEIDGYKAVVSNSVDGIICMDPRDLAVATWSGVEITVDTTSRAIYNEVRLVVNFLVDAKLRGNRIAMKKVTE